MKRLTYVRRLALATLFVGIISNEALGDVVVVVSAKSPVNSLSEREVAAIFLGHGSDVSGGAGLVPLDQPENSLERQNFYQHVTGKSTAQLKTYWSKIIFTGAGQPPREVAGDAATKQALVKDKTAIGYMDVGSVDANVKVVLVLR